MGTPTWAFPCSSPHGTHIFFHVGYTWAFSLGHSHVGPIWDPSLFSYGYNLGTPTWAFPCWSQLGPTSFLMWETPGRSHLGITILVLLGTHIYVHTGYIWAGPNGTHIIFNMGYTWARPLGHSHVRPPIGPTSFFMWDTPGRSHLGIPMLVPIGTHIYLHFSMFLLGSPYVPIWAFLLLFQMVLCK